MKRGRTGRISFQGISTGGRVWPYTRKTIKSVVETKEFYDKPEYGIFHSRGHRFLSKE